MNKKIEVEIYMQEKLKTEVAESFLTSSVILLIEDDPNIVRDILVLIPNIEYGKFVDCYGPNFVVDDHNYEYPIFTKFRNLEWLKDDLKSRLSIALWMYQNSLVIQDPQEEFARLLDYYQIESMKNFLSKNWLPNDLLNRWWLYLK